MESLSPFLQGSFIPCFIPVYPGAPQKSTGPITPEGKARSALNALKSGIDAWSHIIPGEDPAELEALTEQFLRHYQPADPVQLSLVDTLVSTEWIQRRLRRVEAQLWNYQVECLDKNFTHAEFIDISIQHNSPIGHAYQDALEPFTRIQRRIDATNRMFLRTLKALQDLQATPAKKVAQPAASQTPATPFSEPASPVPSQPLKPEIGFVPPSAPASGGTAAYEPRNRGLRPLLVPGERPASGYTGSVPKAQAPGKGHRRTLPLRAAQTCLQRTFRTLPPLA